MSLAVRAGLWLTKAGQLLASCACCASWWCIPDRRDACGRMRYLDCQNTQNPPPGARGPIRQSECSQCDTYTPCEARFCYAGSGIPCTPVYVCRADAFGDGAAFGPVANCSECSQHGLFDCPADKYYCCYDYPPTPALPEPRKSCQLGPCIGSTGLPDESLIASGPHDSSVSCSRQCSRYNCDRLVGCTPSANGRFATLDECEVACGCATENAATCSSPAVVEGNSPYSSKYFSVGPEALTITVAYNAFRIPDRFQIWGPTLDDTGATVARRVIKADSGYRGTPNTCKDDAGEPITLTLAGEGSGQITWRKPAGVRCFEVAVISPCVGTGWTYTVSCQGNPAP